MNQEMKEKLVRLCEEFKRETAVPSISLKIEDRPTTVYDSKLGGIPYMPKGFEYPTTSKGAPLALLAQLNFSQLPKLKSSTMPTIM